MTKRQELAQKQKDLRAKLKGIFQAHKGADGEINPDTLPTDEVDSINKELETITGELDEIVRLATIAADNDAAITQGATGPGIIVPGAVTQGANGGGPVLGWNGKPVKLSHVSPLTSFTGDGAAMKAYRFGQFYLASVMKNARAQEWCGKNGVTLQADTMYEGGDPATGGYLVPEEFSQEIIDLREQYGVFRRNTRVVPMSSDTKSMPRRRGGVNTYYIGEGNEIPPSAPKFDRVRLTARKLATLIVMSSEFDEDSIVDLGNVAADEIAYAFAQAEDQAGFNGDGTSAYGGIVGLFKKLKGLSGTVGDIAGLKVGSGNAWGELTLADHFALVGLLPAFADTPRAKWYCHKSYYFNVMLPLAVGNGATPQSEIIGGVRSPFFMGYPVEFVQVMPKNEANSQVPVVLGDLSLASTMGDRRRLAIAQSEHVKFETDEIVIRGTQRFDINVHDVGNANADATKREPGPVVGLITAAA